MAFDLGGRIMTRPCLTCAAEAREVDARTQAERVRAEAVAKLAERASEIEDILGRLGVTRKYRAKTLAGFDTAPDGHALKAARRFLADYRGGNPSSLFLYSERPGEPLAPGSGKTHLAVAVLRDLALDPAISLNDLGFVFVPRMLLELQSTFKHPEKSELSVVRKYVEPEVLVWDDFGAEKLSDYAARALYTVLYEREGKANIFTSNFSLAQIESRDPSGYTMRITSRIAGEAKIIRFGGPDRRLAAA